MKKITIKDICDLNHYYDPSIYLPEDWSGTVIDILKMENISIKDKFLIVLREEFIDAKRLRLFAVWCAREALKLVENPDPRSIKACDVAERYAKGEATEDELHDIYYDSERVYEAMAEACVNYSWAENRFIDDPDYDAEYYSACAASLAVIPSNFNAEEVRYNASQAFYSADHIYAESQKQVDKLIEMLEEP